MTRYVVSGMCDTVSFDNKVEAEKFAKNMIYDAIHDSMFSIDLFQSFCEYHSNNSNIYSNILRFQKKVDELIELVTDDKSNVGELIQAWNIVFPYDQVQLQIIEE